MKNQILQRKKRASRSKSVNKKIYLDEKRSTDPKLMIDIFNTFTPNEIMNEITVEKHQEKLDLFKQKRYAQFLYDTYKVAPIEDKTIMHPQMVFINSHKNICNTKTDIYYKKPKKKYNAQIKEHYVDFEDIEILRYEHFDKVEFLRVIKYGIEKNYLDEMIYFVVFCVDNKEFFVKSITIDEKRDDGHIEIELFLKVPHTKSNPYTTVVLEFFDLDTFELLDFFDSIFNDLNLTEDIIEIENFSTEEIFKSNTQDIELIRDIEDLNSIEKINTIMNKEYRDGTFRNMV